MLRPTLGHPNHADKLRKLCNEEKQRGEASEQDITDHEVTLKRLAERNSGLFVERVAQAAAELLLLFDDVLTVDDVIKGSMSTNSAAQFVAHVSRWILEFTLRYKRQLSKTIIQN